MFLRRSIARSGGKAASPKIDAPRSASVIRVNGKSPQSFGADLPELLKF